MIFVNFIFICTLFTAEVCGKEAALVHTQYGDVLGYRTDLARVFYGIPFAQPPIGKLRWEPPIPISKWTPNVINATSVAPACAQPASTTGSVVTSQIMSEDCLYLNIFTPLSAQSPSASLLPVMIFIHGGDFQFGGASQPTYESEYFVNTTNVIIALIQYRLGVLGFLATGTGLNDIKGNYGLLDQRLAIAWVKNNIDAFGGNPNEITLFGQSSGAQSAALHYLTSEMQPFFQRAIIQSAPMAIPFRTYAEYITPGVLLAEQLHCAAVDVGCFRNRSTDQIIAAQATVNNMLTSLDILLFFEPWLPVIDNITVHAHLLDLVRNVLFTLKPLIIGTVSEEGRSIIYGQWKKAIPPSEYIVVTLAMFGKNGLKVLERYPPDGSDDQRSLVARIITQWVFVCSTRIFARKAAFYSYVFSYPFDAINRKNSLQCTDHACHGDELPFIFKSGWLNLTDAGRRVSESMATYWTNFAKSQDPNQPVEVSLSWPTVTSGNEKYIDIQDPLQIGENYLKDDCDFWDDIAYKISSS